MTDATLQLTPSNGKGAYFPIEISVSDESEELPTQTATTQSKIRLFLRRYFQQVNLVFQSILPDFRSFKFWQIIILILYATFNVTFTIVVSRSIFFFNEKNKFPSPGFNLFRFSRIQSNSDQMDQ